MASRTPPPQPRPAWGAGPRPGRGAHRLKLALVLAVGGAAVMAGVGVRALNSRDATIAATTERLREARQHVTALQQENTRLTAQMETLLGEIAELQSQLKEARAPKEIGGPVDFPIQRGMARPGDTLAAFAAREGTTVEVVRALNPWLEADTQELKSGQTLWIPTR